MSSLWRDKSEWEAVPAKRWKPILHKPPFPAARPSHPDADPRRLRVLQAQPCRENTSCGAPRPQIEATRVGGGETTERGQGGRHLPDVTNPGHLRSMRAEDGGTTPLPGAPTLSDHQG